MPPEPPRLFSPSNRSLTISLVAAISLVSYNNLSVTAALPAIGDDLGDVALLPWVVTVELLAAAIAVLGIGPLVDSRGVRQVFQVGMIGFVVSSLVCAIAPSMALLIVARVVQGVMTGVVIGSNVSTIGLAYEEEIRPRAYAMVSAVWGVMGIGGPAIAAVLISVAGWRSVFAVCVPVGLIASVLAWGHLPGAHETAETQRFDGAGLGLLSVVTVGLLMATSIASLWALVWLAVAVAVFVAYVRHARREAAPVVRLHHLGARRWRYVHVTSTMAVLAGTGASTFLPLYLRGARDASEGEAAFSVLFLVAGWSTAAFVSSKAQERVHAAYVVRFGTGLLLTSMIVAAVVAGMVAPVPLLMATFVFVGAGIGSVTTSGLTILQGRAAAAEMGRVSSAHQFLRSLGFAYGAAIAGLVLFLVVGLQIDDVETVRELLGGDATTLTEDARSALQDGFVWSLAVTTVFGVVGVASAQKLVGSIGRFAAPAVLRTGPVDERGVDSDDRVEPPRA